MSGLQLCPKCKKGHLYPVVTESANAEPKGQSREIGSIRDYQCAICGFRQKGAKQTRNVIVENKLSASVKKTKKTKAKPRTRTKTKRKRTKQK